MGKDKGKMQKAEGKSGFASLRDAEADYGKWPGDGRVESFPLLHFAFCILLSGGYAAGMSVPHLALLVVDAQPVFLNSVPDGAELGDSCRFVAAAATALGVRVVFTEQRPDKLGATRADIRKAAPGAPVFAKSSFSAFGEEGVAEWLKENEISHLLVAGLETPICVYQTVLGAMAEGLEVTLLTDATGGRRRADHESTLRALEKKSDCHLLPSEAVFYSLMGDASHAAFKALAALVIERSTPAVIAKNMKAKPTSKPIVRPNARRVVQSSTKPAVKSRRSATKRG